MQKKKSALVVGTIILAVLCVVAASLFVIKSEKPKKLTGEKLLSQDISQQNDENEEKKIDFNELKAINEDVYAWIYIPKTKVDYPVLQSKGDQSYYLNNTFEKKEDLKGAIYTENLNAKDFSDPNTVIYGHNMKDGLMFTELHKYEDETFLKQSPYVYIYTPDAKRKYEIFAAVQFDDRHLLKSINFKDPVSFEQFLSDVRGRRDMVSHVNEAVKVDKNNKIITLSTCDNTNEESRWLVTAVLTEEKKTADE